MQRFLKERQKSEVCVLTSGAATRLPGKSDPTETGALISSAGPHMQAAQLHNMQIKHSDWTGRAMRLQGSAYQRPASLSEPKHTETEVN